MPEIPALRSLKQEGNEFETNLDCVGKALKCLKSNYNKNQACQAGSLHSEVHIQKATYHLCSGSGSVLVQFWRGKIRSLISDPLTQLCGILTLNHNTTLVYSISCLP